MAEMAEMCGVSVGYWSKLESGKSTTPSRNLLEVIATKCRVSASWLERGGDKGCASVRTPDWAILVDQASMAAAAIILDRDRWTSLLSAAGNDEALAIEFMKAMVRKSLSEH